MPQSLLLPISISPPRIEPLCPIPSLILFSHYIFYYVHMSDCAKSPIFLLMIVKDTICQLDVAGTDRFPNSSVPYITTSVWNRHNIIGSYSYVTFDRHMMIALPRATRDNNIEVKARVWLPWRERNKYGCGSIATFMTHEWSLFRNMNSLLILKSVTFVSRVASIHWYNRKLCDEI